MKFTKFGKALLMSALSAGVVFSVTSCIQDYSVGYLYVTGTVTAGTSSNGIISGFKIDHNTGKLDPIHGLPVSSGGANPVRAILLTGSRFLYVLNRGVSSNPAGSDQCTTAYPCQNANITQFAIGANGILTFQETFYTQGLNPFRMVADSSGSFIYVLEHDSIGADGINPSSATNHNSICANALTGATTCGDITAYTVNGSTGRLSLIQNAQGSTSMGSSVYYFPVPSNPVDFLMTGGYLLTLNATTATASNSYPYTGGATVYPYSVISNSGQLQTSGPTSDSIGNVTKGTAIVSVGGYVFVLDNEAPSPNSTNATSQILAFTVGTSGALVAANPSVIPDDTIQSNPIFAVQENKGKWFYVANQGNNTTNTGNAVSGIAGYVINSPFQPTEIGTTVSFSGTGAYPQCLVEDPSNQFFYTANYDSTVTGQAIDENSGVLVPLNNSTKAPSQYSLTGPATWCLVDGRTN